MKHRLLAPVLAAAPALTALAGISSAAAGDPSQWGTLAKVNEYEGQHRLAKVNEYEGQHL
jgi:hypothetical protein